MSVEALSGKVFLVISGASKGIGRQIAITFGSLLQEGSRVLLLARNLNALHEVARNIPATVTVNTVSMDLSKVAKKDLEEAILSSLKGTAHETFERVVLVHNAASMGTMLKLNNLADLNEWRAYYDLNVFMPAMLNTVVMNLFQRTSAKKVVINLTSLFAIDAMAGCGYYCTGKAAREMYFKVFALENPDVDVLNYSPGAVETDMYDTLCKGAIEPADKESLIGYREKKTILMPEETVNRLVKILMAHKYKSGDHVDYFDAL